MSSRGSGADLPLRQAGDRLVLTVRLTPRADRDRIDGLGRDADGRPYLAIRVDAPPVEGAANAALIRFLAAHWGLPRRAVSLLSGATARMKRVEIAGTVADFARIQTDLARYAAACTADRPEGAP